jgi:MoaA/NifB/PqqE/SkfB family radical SAM enzyme
VFISGARAGMSFPSFPFRMQYFRVARQALREGRLGWLLSTAAKTVAVPLSHQVGRPLAGPLMGILIPTYRCNNACFMCDLPNPRLYKARGEQEFTTAELKGVIDDMAAIGVAGLTLTGGEPTIRPDCFELLAYGRRRGLFVHLNSNGYNLLARPDRIDELLASGIDAMNLSVDGATAETHNRLRKAVLGFERIEKATELILARRRGGKPTITYTFVLGPDNCDEVPAFVELARRRGVNSVSFIPLAGCYNGARAPDPDRLEAMNAAARWLRAEKRRADDPEFIDNSDSYISLFPRAFRGEASPLRCYVGYHNVMVDCYGNVYPCALHYELGRALGNVCDTPLRELWYTDEYQRRREELSTCTDCYWNCHTEVNLLYQSPQTGNA